MCWHVAPLQPACDDSCPPFVLLLVEVGGRYCSRAPCNFFKLRPTRATRRPGLKHVGWDSWIAKEDKEVKVVVLRRTGKPQAANVKIGV